MKKKLKYLIPILLIIIVGVSIYLYPHTEVMQIASKGMDNYYGTLINMQITAPNDKFEVYEGESLLITLEISFEEDDQPDVIPKTICTSSNPEVAAIIYKGGGNGLTAYVEGIKEGTAIISAITEDGTMSANRTITVKKKQIEELEITTQESEVKVGENLALEYSFKPAGVTEKVKWTSSDTQKATVNDYGVVKGLSTGEVDITVQTEDGRVSDTKRINIIDNPNYVRVTGIEITTQESEVEVGDDLKLELKITPNSATNKNIIWTSSDETIALVDDDGYVTGLKEGNVIITANVEDEDIKATKNIHVKAEEPSSVNIALLTINGNSKVKVGEYTDFEMTYLPTTATNTNVIWSSSDTSVATVDQNGRVTGKKVGTATIKVKAEVGEAEATKQITVEEATQSDVGIAKIEITTQENEVKIGQYLGLYTRITKTGISENENVIWTSSDENIATVSTTGVVKGIKEGTVTITVKAEKGDATASKAIKVIPDPDAGKITKLDITDGNPQVKIGKYNTLGLELTIEPKDVTEEYEWVSSDTSIATVSQKGVITGIKEGKVTITVQTKDKRISDSINVTIIPDPDAGKITKLEIQDENPQIEIGKPESLTLLITPKDRTEKIKWISSDESIATVAENGIITGLKEGEVMISVATEDFRVFDAKKVKIVKSKSNSDNENAGNQTDSGNGSDSGNQTDGGNGSNSGNQTDGGNGSNSGNQTDGGNGSNSGSQTDGGNGSNSGSQTDSGNGSNGGSQTDSGNGSNGGSQTNSGNVSNSGSQTNSGSNKTSTISTNNGTTAKTSLPKTGDNNILLLIVISIALTIAIYLYKKQKNIQLK